MAKIRKHDSDPVYVTALRGSVRLRIGPPEQGKSRIAYLSPREAREIAYYLLLSAERAGERKT